MQQKSTSCVKWDEICGDPNKYPNLQVVKPIAVRGLQDSGAILTASESDHVSCFAIAILAGRRLVQKRQENSYMVLPGSPMDSDYLILLIYLSFYSVIL